MYPIRYKKECKNNIKQPSPYPMQFFITILTSHHAINMFLLNKEKVIVSHIYRIWKSQSSVFLLFAKRV